MRSEGGARFTYLLDAVDQRTQRIERDVAEIKVRERLEQLDREWMIERGRYVTRDKRGQESMPDRFSVAMTVIGTFIMGAFSIFWIITAIGSGAPELFVLFGVGVFVLIVIGAVAGLSRGQKYAQAERRYQDRRQALLRDLAGDTQRDAN